MKKALLLSLLFLFAGWFANAQDAPISEFDLYGTWVFEWNDREDPPERLYYSKRIDSDSILSENWIRITLLAFDECKIESSYSGNGWCATETSTSSATPQYWLYTPKNETVLIFSNNEPIKKMSKTELEKNAISNPEQWTEYQIIRLPNNQLGLE
ncbi:hypothetical protein [Zobellia nedashkovskayae]|uniref:hypothetical protein n=1 Tax=Zobellia nedashkovskayae TaxID=2779510 RepID=UPI00188D2ABF|nr:hypothetical protein [Zobellia nedashkovskayae]